MRIFLKIFLSFWLTLLLMAAAVAWVGYQFRGEEEARLAEEREQLTAARDQIARLLEREGAEAAREALAAHPRRDSLFVVDPTGAELLGRETPRRGERLAASRHRTMMIRPARVISADGGRYRLLAHAPSPQRLQQLLAAPYAPLAALAVSALLAWLLARHFAAPVRRLRLAAKRLAEGELTARAGPLRRRLPDELSGLAEDFDRMAERLQKLVSAHKGLLRDVSHELRSPLARLRVALGLAERKAPEAAAELERMEREVERLDGMIGWILTLARIDAGERPTRDHWIDLTALAAAVVEDARFEASESAKRVTLETEGPALLPADDRLLRAALENVVRNALRHTPEGGAVEVTLRREGGEAVIAVRDPGHGVPEEALGRIFDPFTRLSEAREREGGGYGLGLAIAASAIRAHDGTVAAANRPEGGLEVTIRLPVSDEALEES